MADQFPAFQPMTLEQALRQALTLLDPRPDDSLQAYPVIVHRLAEALRQERDRLAADTPLPDAERG